MVLGMPLGMPTKPLRNNWKTEHLNLQRNQTYPRRKHKTPMFNEIKDKMKKAF
jgi:hypothetical protein